MLKPPSVSNTIRHWDKLLHDKIVSYIYPILPRNVTVRLCNSQSADKQGQETTLGLPFDLALEISRSAKVLAGSVLLPIAPIVL